MVTRALCAALLLGAGACTSPAPAPEPEPELRVEGNTVIYRGRRLVIGTKLTEWKRAFGDPSRYVDRDGGIYVWDDRGLAVSLRYPFPQGDPHVAALRIFFVPREVDFWPRSVFRGGVAFAQEAEEPGGPPVLATLRAGVTAFDLEHHQHLSTRYGFPNLSPYTVLRFAPSGGIGLELCSVQVDPRAVRLPWEAPPP
ncbi:MAG TPA: hypothetical protein VIG99_21750 [Myxococcaceae bacterium]|jgi:hypothetical protein